LLPHDLHGPLLVLLIVLLALLLLIGHLLAEREHLLRFLNLRVLILPTLDVVQTFGNPGRKLGHD
jgi:hypothetical protein